MEIRVASLTSGANAAVGTTVIIDVFRAFTTAAVAFSRGAHRIIMVDTLDKALALRSSGVGDYCLGEGTASSRRASTSAIRQPSWRVPRWPGRP